MPKLTTSIRNFFRTFGPGVVTGAADNDPSGIATYSQTGAQFGYSQLWTAIYMLPFLVAIQEVCARIGAVTGKGLAKVIADHYSKKILYLVVFLVLIANTINIGADIGALAAAAHLLIPIHFMIIAVFFTFLILFLEIFIRYKTYSYILIWLSLSLIAYPLTVFMVKQPWLEILKATFVPHVEYNFKFLFIITGVFGTTISPYLFFWQTVHVVEEEKQQGYAKKDGKPQVSQKVIRNVRIDNAMGMSFSEITTWSIIVIAATVLHANGVTDIKDAAEVAKTLEPLVQSFPHSGFLAKLIFATGIIGLGLLSIPILAGSAAYALSASISLKRGLDYTFQKAKGFYVIIIVATMVGLLMNFIGINPMKALVYAAVINGVVAVPLIFIIALIGRNKKIMGKRKSGWASDVLVWLTFVGMAASSVFMFISFFK